jgi:hypothetical protein
LPTKQGLNIIVIDAEPPQHGGRRNLVDVMGERCVRWKGNGRVKWYFSAPYNVFYVDTLICLALMFQHRLHKEKINLDGSHFCIADKKTVSHGNSISLMS